MAGLWGEGEPGKGEARMQGKDITQDVASQGRSHPQHAGCAELGTPKAGPPETEADGGSGHRREATNQSVGAAQAGGQMCTGFSMKCAALGLSVLTSSPCHVGAGSHRCAVDSALHSLCALDCLL